MCARYYIDDFLVKQVEDELDKVEGQAPIVKGGDMRPSERAPVLAAGIACGGTSEYSLQGSRGEKIPCWASMDWGFPSQAGKNLIINGRSETVRERYTFRECFANRRCVIPANAFYEWDSRKEKVSFYREDRGLIYLAGLYKDSLSGHRFVILTTQAPEEVSHIHGRIPLILGKEDVAGWIYDEALATALLCARLPRLRLHKEYEQQRFFF